MIKTSSDIEHEFIATAYLKTGRSLQSWLKIVQSSGLENRSDILNWLKNSFAINHLQAQLIAGIYLNHGYPVYSLGNDLLDHQFTVCPGMRIVFERLATKIIFSFERAQLTPRKTYLAFTVRHEFAVVQIKTNALWLGLDLGAVPFSDTLHKSTLCGPQPNMTHMLSLPQKTNLTTSYPRF